ncbi:MAG: hypothetical protein QNJ63_08555 [Calothrix sp. MO_192.B10]|nr:hypothetical protein [Calothrix sp. MO_192.B10]
MNTIELNQNNSHTNEAENIEGYALRGLSFRGGEGKSMQTTKKH